MFSKCLFLWFWILLLFLPKCSLPYLPPFPRTAGTGVRGQLQENEFSCWLTCLFCDSSIGTNAGLLFYWFAFRSVIWHTSLTEIVVVVVLATWKWLWCWQSPAAPGKEACAQADRKVLDGGWSGECRWEWPCGRGHRAVCFSSACPPCPSGDCPCYPLVKGRSLKAS